MLYNLEVFLASERHKWYPSPSSLRPVSSSETESKFWAGSFDNHLAQFSSFTKKQKTQRNNDLPKVTELKATRTWGSLVPLNHSAKKNQCLLFVKQNNKNEKCGFPSHFLKESEPYSVYGNNIDVTSLLATHKRAMRYLEIIPESIIVSEWEPPFHYCWQTTILSRNWMYEKVFLYYKSIIGKNLQSYFGL